MLNKGITVRTILLLVIGIIIVTVIVYLVYSTYTGSNISSTTCMSKVIEWCTACKLKGTAAWTCTGSCCSNSDPTKCSCLSSGTNWDRWVQGCVDDPSLKDSARWNFDLRTPVGSYEQRAKEYCKRVGVE